MNHLIMAVFPNALLGKSAEFELKSLGYELKKINVPVSKRITNFHDDESQKDNHKIIGELVTSSVTGGLIGFMGGLLFGIGAIDFPGAEFFLTGGAFVNYFSLSGIVATSVNGLMLGILIGAVIGSFSGINSVDDNSKTDLNQQALLTSMIREEDTLITCDLFEKYGASKIRILPVK
jgi:hypothetical protein